MTFWMQKDRYGLECKESLWLINVNYMQYIKPLFHNEYKVGEMSPGSCPHIEHTSGFFLMFIAR